VQNASVTIAAGRHSAPPIRRVVPTRTVAGYAGGVLLAGAAWLFLVRAAIDFGAAARGGEGLGWLFLALAVAGAIGCLLLALVLGGRVLMATGIVSDYKPRRAQNRR
jgi:hypothetical protein